MFLKNKTRILSAFLCVLMLLLSVPFAAFAAEGTVQRDISQTLVLEDLQAADGFSFLNYPVNHLASVEDCKLFNVVEFDGALYLYIYNPSCKALVEDSKLNQVQMATKYDTDQISEESKAKDYEKFDLQFVSVATGSKQNLFYKFKVLDHISADGKTIAQRVDPKSRRYDVSGITLLMEGSDAHEIAVDGTYIFTGEGKDLACNVKFLETISIDVQHSFWRSKTGEAVYLQNQVNTVWFNVPKSYLEDGSLKRIKADWYEYQTKWMVALSDFSTYYELSKFIGQEIEKDPAFNQDSDTTPCKYGLACLNSMFGNIQAVNHISMWSWNYAEYTEMAFANKVKELIYLFYVSNIEEFDPYQLSDGTITGSTLLDYMHIYSVNHPESGYLDVELVDGYKLVKDLFENDISDERKKDDERGKIQQGYSYYDFDINLDNSNWSSWDDVNNSLAADFLKWWFDIPDEQGKALDTIYTLTADDLVSEDDKVVADLLCIQVSDVPALRKSFAEAQENNEAVIIFRFAVSDYWSIPLTIFEYDAGIWNIDKKIEGEAYAAKQSVFLNFDVIQLGVEKDGEYIVIPVVADPVDIINPVTPPTVIPPDFDKGDQIALGVIMLIILVVIVLLAIFCPGALWWIFKIIFFPIWFIGKLLNWSAKLFAKRKLRKQAQKMQKKDD